MKKTRLLKAAFLALCLTAPALAILGVGDLVYDPTNFAEAVKELAQMEQQYGQLVMATGLLNNQYQEMLRMAKMVPVNMITRYRAANTPWTPYSARDAFGTTTPWTVGANSGINISGAYSLATQGLGSYGGVLGNIPSNQLDRIKNRYATVELTDGANVTAMQSIGSLRGKASAVDAAIQNLELDSLSQDPAMNTEIAVLNKINAAHVISLRSAQDTNNLLISLTEEQVIQAKRQRDAEADAFNDHIQFLAQAQGVMTAQSAGSSAAMLAWRMP